MGDEGNTFRPQIDAFTLYHLIQEENGRSVSSSSGTPTLPPFGHALAGSVATATAKSIVYPLSLVITRLQVQRQLRQKGETESAAKDANKEYSSILDAAQKIYKTEGGLGTFYTGVASDVTKGILDSFLFFLSYTALRQLELKRNGNNAIPMVKELGIGVAAGSFSKFVTQPIDNIVTRQQTASLSNARDPEQTSQPSPVGIARQIYNERGIAGFWSGYGEAIVLTSNPSITFAVDNLLTQLLPKSQRAKPSATTRFFISALSKAVATTITYPAMLAKSRAQVSDIGSDEEERLEESIEHVDKPDLESTPRRRKVKSTLQSILSVFAAQYAIVVALRKIYRTEGLAGLYSGIEGEVVKGFLQHGLTMMVKEKAQVVVLQLYYVLLKATARWPAELEKAQERARTAVTDAAGDVQERVTNVAETVSEGAKRFAENVTGSEAQERVSNVTETLSEGAKKLKKDVRGDE